MWFPTFLLQVFAVSMISVCVSHRMLQKCTCDKDFHIFYLSCFFFVTGFAVENFLLIWVKVYNMK